MNLGYVARILWLHLGITRRRAGVSAEMTRFLRAFSARFLSITAVAAALIVGVAATPAHAIAVPWSGAGSSGVDGAPTTNLGDTWQLTGSNMVWAISPAPSTFDSTVFSNSFGPFATAFQFTINSGVAGIGSAQLMDLTTSQTGTRRFHWPRSA